MTSRALNCSPNLREHRAMLFLACSCLTAWTLISKTRLWLAACTINQRGGGYMFLQKSKSKVRLFTYNYNYQFVPG